MGTNSVIAQKLLQIQAVKLSPQEPFTWASGIKSPIYCDNRLVLSYPDIRSLVIDSFAEEAQAFQPFDLVAGVATAGIAHGALLAEKLGLPFVYVRSKAKKHGRQNKIEGDISTGSTAIVIEDLISTGGSSVQAVEALREANIKVKAVLAIFSYQLPAAAATFGNADCPYHSLSDYNTLLSEAVSLEYVSPNDLATLKAWKEAPEKWEVSG